MGVGIYCRISEDTAGLALGVKRQEADCRAVAKRRGWKVAYVAIDNDVSAYKNVVRPEFERLLTDLEAGAIDGIVTYDLDRFARRPVDLERAIELFDKRPAVFATVQSDIDLSTPDGRTMARIMVAFANKSSMDTSRRVKRKHLELARSGVPVGGNRPFGYKADKVTIELKEAKLIREAAEDILAGVGLHTIARRWNEKGITTTRGNPWRYTVLRNMLRSPRLAGFRVYQGDIARQEDGSPVVGLFKPILDLETWEKVVAVITDPTRHSKNVHVGKRKYLLSSIVRCALCGQTLVGNADTKWQTFNYICPSPTNGGCGKVSVSGPRLDELISSLVLVYLSERRIEHDALPWSREEELAAATARIQELMNQYGEGTLSGDVVFPTVQRLETVVAQLRGERNDWIRGQVVTRPTNASEAWPDMEVDQQRSVVASMLQAVLIRPAHHRGARFDPTRVDPVWREGAQPAASARR